MTKLLSCCDLRCFDATSILSHFTHFCVEQKFTQKSFLWSKNDTYHGWLKVIWNTVTKSNISHCARCHITQPEEKIQIVTTVFELHFAFEAERKSCSVVSPTEKVYVTTKSNT